MTGDGEAPDGGAGAGRLREALRSRAGLAVERMPGLARAFGQFVAEAQRNLAPLLGVRRPRRNHGAGAHSDPFSGDRRLQWSHGGDLRERGAGSAASHRARRTHR